MSMPCSYSSLALIDWCNFLYVRVAIAMFNLYTPHSLPRRPKQCWTTKIIKVLRLQSQPTLKALFLIMVLFSYLLSKCGMWNNVENIDFLTHGVTMGQATHWGLTPRIYVNRNMTRRQLSSHWQQHWWLEAHLIITVCVWSCLGRGHLQPLGKFATRGGSWRIDVSMLGHWWRYCWLNNYSKV